MLSGVCSQEVLAIPALPTFADVVFLSSFDGTDYGTSAVDRSSKNAPISFLGEAHLDALVKKFGTTSYACIATSPSGVKVPASTDYNLITGDFTIEGFMRNDGGLSYNAVIAGVFGGGPSFAQSQWSFMMNSVNLTFSIYGANARSYCNVQHGMTGGQFYHVVVCRCNYVIRVFVNGIMLAKEDFYIRTVPSSTIGMSFGCDWDLNNTSYSLIGFLDEVRVTKKAWYRTDASFTPPVAPFGTLSPGLFVDTDTFYSPRSNPYTLSPSRVIDTDVIPVPRVNPYTVTAPLVTAADVIFAPAVHTTTHWDTTFSQCALSGSNLIATNNQGTGPGGAFSDINAPRNSGLLYWELGATSVGGSVYSMGVIFTSFTYNTLTNSAVGGLALYSSGHIFRNGIDLGALMPGMVSGETYGFACHASRRLLWIRKVSGTPGNWNGDPTADPLTVTGGLSIPAGSFILPHCTLGGTGGSGSDVVTANFGTSAFVGAVPAGYESGYVGGI